MTPSLLIAEDHESARELILHALEGEGYELKFAKTGPEAIEELRKRTFTAAILDHALPGVTGADICRQVKADPDLLRTPVILMSGAIGARELEHESSEAGADAFLAKPFSLDELRTVVRAFTKIREQEDEIAELRSKLQESRAELSASEESSGQARLDWGMPYHDFMKLARKKYFLHALALAGGNKSRLARKSGLDRSTLYVHFRNLGMLPTQKKPIPKKRTTSEEESDRGRRGHSRGPTGRHDS